jgi:hypothetical protein
MTQTQPALAAKAIKAKLKALGVNCRVKSRTFSMGNAVDIYTENVPPFLLDKVRAIADLHQYGHFDGMADIYEYSNTREDLPQAKYVQVNNDLSDSMREAVYQHLRTQWAGGEVLPATYAEARNIQFHNEYVQHLVWQEFCRASSTFWQERNAA